MGQRDEAEMGCGSRSLIHLLLFVRTAKRPKTLGRALTMTGGPPRRLDHERVR
jgi:hypothetical protein